MNRERVKQILDEECLKEALPDRERCGWRYRAPANLGRFRTECWMCHRNDSVADKLEGE